MKRILLTGMSGCGKSTVLAALAGEDTLCVELDESEWVAYDAATGERYIRADALLEWMRRQNRNIVLAVCESNQKELYPALDAVIVLTAPVEVMRQRILARANPYGKREEEWRAILRDKAEVEPLLLKNCTYACDTARPLETVLWEIRQFL